MKICKDGRIWGQNNREAGDHLGIKTSKPFVRKGYNMNSAYPKGHKLTYGKKHPMYGICRLGEKNGNWKGGVTSLRKRIRDLPEYKQWRSDVYKRDYWTCQTCNKKGGKIKIHAHHIKSFIQIIRDNNITSLIEAQFCKELWDIDNGVTLCKICHDLTKQGRPNILKKGIEK